jgi:hypothetical protein
MEEAGVEHASLTKCARICERIHHSARTNDNYANPSTPNKNLSDCTLRPTSLHWCNARTRSG